MVPLVRSGALVILLGCQWQATAENPIFPVNQPVGIELSTLETAGSARFEVFGDQGRGESGQFKVATAMANQQAARPANALILLGDNFYPSGVTSVDDHQWVSAFLDPYPATVFPGPVYVVAGNHDYLGNIEAEYSYVDHDGRWTLDSPAEVLPVSVDGQIVAEIYFVDSEQIVENTEQGLQEIQWVKARVARSTAHWKVLSLHHAPISHGVHGNSNPIRKAFEEEFDSGAFQLVLAGHDHDLELSQYRKTFFAVSGAAAETRPIGTGPTQLFGSSKLGYLEVGIRPDRLELSFLGTQGQILFEKVIGPQS